MSNLVIRAIEEDRPPLADTESQLERSRFVCYPCTREVHGLVICDGPVCKRCTRYASVQQVLNGDEPVPQPQTAEEKRMTGILAKHQAMNYFRLPPSKSKPESEPVESTASCAALDLPHGEELDRRDVGDSTPA